MNIWKILYLNCEETYGFMIDHRSYTRNLSSCEIKSWKNSGLHGIRTHDLCDTGAVLCRLSYQAIWELVTSWVRNIPVQGEGCKWKYERSYIWSVNISPKNMKLTVQRLRKANIPSNMAPLKHSSWTNAGYACWAMVPGSASPYVHSRQLVPKLLL